MATAEELLMTTNESADVSNDEIIIADLTTRVIGIPAGIKILGVESDDDVKRLQFKIPRYYGEFDLSTFDIRINFENARHKGDVYPVEDLVITEDDHLTFSWLVDRIAFDYAGDVKFSICMKLFDNTGMVIKELNTTYATLPVLEGLETEKAVVDQNPSAFDHVMFRLYAVEAATGNGQNGYYSVVKVTEAGTGVLFTIVNQDGETVAYVRHGNDGEDGYTPVKGKDYWTEADKNEIKSETTEHTKAYIDNWAPGYITVTLEPDKWTASDGNYTHSVTVTGVTANNIVIVSPDTDAVMYDEYAFRRIRCIQQSEGALTFLAESLPTINVFVNVAIYHAQDSLPGNGHNIIVTDDGSGNVVIT